MPRGQRGTSSAQEDPGGLVVPRGYGRWSAVPRGTWGGPWYPGGQKVAGGSQGELAVPGGTWGGRWDTGWLEMPRNDQ